MSSFYQFHTCLHHIWSTLCIVWLLWSAFLCRGLLANWSKEAFSSKPSNPSCSTCCSQMTSKSLWDALGPRCYMLLHVLYYCPAHERNRIPVIFQSTIESAHIGLSLFSKASTMEVNFPIRKWRIMMDCSIAVVGFWKGSHSWYQ